MTFDGNQIKELREIFKTEAINHIKTVAKVLIRLADEGTEDAIKDLGQAYAAAHGLKGSASTIGLVRASSLTSRLEEALHVITRDQRKLSFDDVDLLLEGLDAVRSAVDDVTTDAADVASLTPRDEAILVRLQTFINSGEQRISSPSEQKSSETRRSLVGRQSRSSIPETKFSQAPRRTSTPPNRPPSGPPPSVALKAAREMDIPQDQLQYLVSVFHAEAAEHIKALAETLFNLEEGKSDVAQLLVNAFRQAHSLKGSAGTIGFDRVATVTHALEDALGALQKNQHKISTEIVDVLLDTLDVIRRAVKDSQIGDAELTAKESIAVTQCRKVAADLASTSAKEAPPSPATKSSEPTLRVDRATPPPPPTTESDGEKLSSFAPSASVNLQAQSKDEFIRVSEESIENLIGHVGEMFEAHLHLMSVTSDLSKLESSTENFLRSLQKWISENTSASASGDREKILDSLKALRAQMGLVSKRFLHDEREFSKLIQTSQDALQKIRLAPISTIFVMIRRQVREICRITNKRVELFLDGGEYAVDRKVLEAIEDPLIHLIRNAVDHGMEDTEGRVLAGKPDRGKLSVVARHVGDAVELVISDDGRGIDPEKVRETVRKRKLVKESEINNLTKDQLFDFLFESGFSTTTDVSKISGRGVGLDVVKFTMERLGGEVRISSKLGKGTSFSLRLPLSMSTLRCLLVRVSGRVMAIPASNVDKVILQNAADVQRVGGGEVIIFNNQNVALSKLGDLLHIPPGGKKKSTQRMIVIVSFGERRVAFDVDDIVEYAQLILRPLGDLLERVSYVSGVSLLGTGEVALVLNPSDLVRATGQKAVSRNFEPTKEKKSGAMILIVDDSMTTRTLEKTILEGAGYSVMTASDGYQALDIIGSKKCDLVVTDIQMPNMDGLTLTRNIKTQYRYLQLPVILVSSMGSDEDKAKGLESGADAYIVKMDLSQRDLVETIEQLL